MTLSADAIVRGLGQTIGRWWRRHTRCRFGRHRDTIYTTQTEYPVILGFFAPPRDGSIAFACWDCCRVEWLGTWHGRATNRKEKA